MNPVKVDLPYLFSDEDRHGNARLYVRRNGRKIRMREQPGTRAFQTAYAAAVQALENPGDKDAGKKKPALPGTLGWLTARYYASTKFKNLDADSQQTRRLILDGCLREPLKPGSTDLMRDCPLSHFSSKHIQALMDRKHEKPGAANNRLKYLSAMFGWGVPHHITRNPARDISPIHYSTSGFHSWSVAEVEQFKVRHPIGTKAHLALALLLYTGSRRGDMVTFGRQMVSDEWLRFIPKKTQYKRMDMSEKPILPELRKVLDVSPCGDLTYLVTDHRQPFTAAGFGNWFRDRCDEAGLPHCSAHGLRKAGAAIAAENGATERQLMAIYDWTSPSQASVYTAKASKKKLAGDAMKLIVSAQVENTELTHPIDPLQKTKVL